MQIPAAPRATLRRGLTALALCASLGAGAARADELQEANALLKAGQHQQALERVNKALATKPRERDFVVVTFDQDYRSDGLSNVMRKRQYWVNEGARWKIIYEGAG